MAINNRPAPSVTGNTDSKLFSDLGNGSESQQTRLSFKDKLFRLKKVENSQDQNEDENQFKVCCLFIRAFKLKSGVHRIKQNCVSKSFVESKKYIFRFCLPLTAVAYQGGDFQIQVLLPNFAPLPPEVEFRPFLIFLQYFSPPVQTLTQPPLN